MAERSNTQISVATTIAIAIGVLVAAAGSDGGAHVGSIPVFALCAALAFAINWLAFIPSAVTEERFGSVPDELADALLRAAAMSASKLVSNA
jgi:hypothetical protein